MRRALLLLFAVAAIAAVFFFARPEAPRAAPAPGRLATAVFAGGCFWCTEADFDAMPGVVSTASGYSGGRVANPSYEQVSAGTTGHIEVVRVTYDPARISYRALVARFFRTIDPLDGKGQFCDRGPQYRPAVFVATPAERRDAEAVKARAAQLLRKPIAAEILPAAPFYAAEDYHQDYYRKNPARYNYYKWRCGRAARVKQVWGKS
jgi:peptide-methionine (S)-S-oxide reductase